MAVHHSRRAQATVVLCCTICILFIRGVQSACSSPIDLNTASVSELDSLPFVSSSAARLITEVRPICSPQELTEGAKKIRGITSRRLEIYWKWYSQQDTTGYSCAETCCKAVASCSSSTAPTITLYSWQTSNFSDCSAPCNTGTQYRTVTCGDATHTVPDALCFASTNGIKPADKQLCNTHKCPVYEWVYSEWSACDAQCRQTRVVDCYETVYNTLEQDTLCASNGISYTTQSCERCLTMENTEIIKMTDDISVEIDLLHEYNQQQCHTNLYRNVDDVNTLITRRSCSIDIGIRVLGNTAPVDASLVDVSWFYLEATLIAKEDESVGNEWNDNYLSWNAVKKTEGIITITFPADAAIGKFLCNLYYQHQGAEANRILLKQDMTLFVLFNPYSSADDVYVSSITNRQEYVENENGLIWQGSSSDNAGYSWNYAHFEFKNLLIAMKMLDRLSLAYRDDLVLISRQISYAVGKDICHGKWGSGSYTTGRPYGGYYCSKTRTCHDPLSWRGTTELFDVYRDELNYAHSVQYCQCFVFAGVTTTVGRALGIATRPVSNFQSAHDTDFNRGVDKYWIFDVESKTYEATSYGADSVWSFHVWNEMYFKRTDFIGSADSYNMRGWQAVDATPQEQSFGGNPALANDDASVYQMGPASLVLIQRNINSNECSHAPANHARFGCFDTEFVISEVNANYNFWWKRSDAGATAPFILESSYKTDPWGDAVYTIGQQISTKKPGNRISAKCLDATVNDCSDELLDVTWTYKYREPSGGSMPTDKRNYYTKGQSRQPPTRRILLFGADSNRNETSTDFDSEGIEYVMDSVPELWRLTPMIIAEDRDEIIDSFGSDFTFGMMSMRIDSYFDNPLHVYCSFTVTAHDYSGKADNNTIKIEKTHVRIDAGESGSCAFYVNYTEYKPWTDILKRDVSELPRYFQLALSVTVFDGENSTEPYKAMSEERDFTVCSPIYKLRDRIICHNGLIWFEPSYELEYECDAALRGIGDGFCDSINNVDGCWDGGDCCVSSCVPSDLYSCAHFICRDDRANKQNIDYFKCHEPLLFISYMERLIQEAICVDTEQSIQNFKCTQQLWTQRTGDACTDAVVGYFEGRVIDDIVTCFNETYHSVSGEMKQVIGAVLDCSVLLQSADNANATVTPVWMETSRNEHNIDDSESKKQSSSKGVWVGLVIVLCVVVGVSVFWYVVMRPKQSSNVGGNAMKSALLEDADADEMEMGQTTTEKEKINVQTQ